MTTISNFQTAAQATSYLEKDNYYLKDGLTETGNFGGVFAQKLGFDGNVDMKDFYLLANGINPNSLDDKDNVTGTLKKFDKLEAEFTKEANTICKIEDISEKALREEALQQRIKEHNKEREAFNKGLGEAKIVTDTKNQDNILTHQRAGFDMTFSAPKSVSLAALVLGDKKLTEAHKEATQESMKYIEKHFAQTRVYNQEGVREHQTTSNLAYTSFTHYTSRATDNNMPDPQLHTHNFVFNMTQAQDGSIKSIDNIEIARAVTLAGQMYQNSLAKKAQELGYSLEWKKNGNNYTFELKGIDKELLDNFSKRTQQIEEAIAAKEKELGRSLSDEEKSIVNLETRAYKEVMNMENLHSNWNKQVAEHGYSKEQILKDLKIQDNDKELYKDKQTIIEQSIKTLETTKSVYSQHEILHESLKLSQGQFTKEEMLHALKENTKELNALEKDADTNLLGSSKSNAMTELYSSKKIIDAEKAIFAAVDSGKDTGAIIDKDEYSKIIKSQDYNLTQGQEAASIHIATSKDKIIGIQGDAGVGKTTMLKQLNEALGDKVEFIGLAPTGKAASEIESVTGIKSRTVDSFLLKNTQETSNKPKVYLVDEASMMDTLKIEKLIDKSKKEDAKVVFIGDTKQLKAVGAGDMFYKLQNNDMSIVKMEQGIRQQNEFSRTVVDSFKNQDIKSGLDTLSQNNKLFAAQKNESGEKDLNKLQEEFIKNVTDKYEKQGLDSTLVLVATNTEKQGFNNEIRSNLIERGVVDTNQISIDALNLKNLSQTDKQFVTNYEKEDVLIFSKHQGDIKSGQKIEVLDIDKEKNLIHVQYAVGKNQDIKEKWIEGTKLQDVNAYKKQSKEFAVGDKIVFEKNDKNTGVKNGEFGIIREFGNDGSVTIDKNGSEVQINQKDYNYINHAYVVTTHKSQGQSIDNVVVWADSKSQNLNAGYVQVSRAKHDIEIYTDDKDRLQTRYEQEQVKENASDFVNLKEQEQEKQIEEVKNSLQELAFELKEKVSSAIEIITAKIENLKEYLNDKNAIEEKIESIKEEIQKESEKNEERNENIDFDKDYEKDEEKELPKEQEKEASQEEEIEKER